MPSFRINLQWAAISEVLPNLYISGITALKPAELRALGIDLIVNCTSEIPNLNCLQECHRVKLWLEDEDSSDAFVHFDPVADQMEMVLSNRGKVLVHCVAGVSRSAAMCLAYLLKYRCRSLREAYWMLNNSRPMVRPNLGFWRQLISYEQAVKKQPPSVRLVWVKTERRRRASGESVCSSSGSVTDSEMSNGSPPNPGAGILPDGTKEAECSSKGAPVCLNASLPTSSTGSLSAAIANGTVVGDESSLEPGALPLTEMMLVPDVYMPIIIPDRRDSPTHEDPCCANGENQGQNNGHPTPLGAFVAAESRERRTSGQKAKFVPRLEPVVELNSDW